MNKKQYEECFERLDKYVFSRDMAVKEDWYDLLNYHHKQLQAYKDKEDKIREYIRTYKEPLYISDDLLEFLKIILNEGE